MLILSKHLKFRYLNVLNSRFFFVVSNAPTSKMPSMMGRSAVTKHIDYHYQGQ
jgi:hypothetical protein